MSAEKNTKQKTKYDDKEYDSKRLKRVFQTRWHQEFPWLTVDDERGVTKCKICCMWPTISDPQSPLVLGSVRFRKDPLYTHAKSVFHIPCVTRESSVNVPLKDTPLGKTVVPLEKE